jgi:phthiocerol/phenolphthiocerol synthesis type-I polyketide synthase D
MKLGLMFFAASEDATAADKYRLVVESARFADANGFASVWVPERHFTKFGSLYPNPAVLHAGLAMVTDRVALRAGSVVGPLHHPMRIAEEWSVVDNLSKGRVGISFAPGWNPDDFAFFPDRYAKRYEHLREAIETVRRLWRGETLEALNGEGKTTHLRLYPSPVQWELPVWVTAAAADASYLRAGELGANLLTHLLDQTEEELARKIGLYREARHRAGFDGPGGIVTVMLHTFVGADAEKAREQARDPYCEYLRNNIGLLNGLARSRGQQVDVGAMNPADLAEFVAFLYDRFAATRGLIGSPESCLPLLRRMEHSGVNEVACLLDFGPEAELILENLPQLARLRRMVEEESRTQREESFDLEAVLARCGEEETGDAFHERLSRYGVEIAAGSRGIERIWRGEREAVARLRLPAGEDDGLRPAHLDACSRVLAAAFPALREELYMPVQVGRVQVTGTLAGELWSHARLRDAVSGTVLVYAAEDGRLVARIEDLQLRALGGAKAERAAIAPLYRTVWERAGNADVAPVDAAPWLVVERVEELPERVDAGRVLVAGGGIRTLLEAVRRVHAPAKLWVVTRGAMAVTAGDCPDPDQAAVWALGRTIAVEQGAMWGGLIDAECGTPLDCILTAAKSGEGMQALRGGEAFVPRLVAGSLPAGSPQFTSTGTYLITGGTGGIGQRLSVWLRAHGAEHIAILARRAGPVNEGDRLFLADMGDARALDLAIEEIRREMPPIRGLFHLAGALDDALLETQTWERFEAAGAGKRDGALLLDRALAEDPLECFVLFSSLAALAPAPGQGNYAAANAALDALAWRRRAEGRPALSINWGPWAEVGHAATSYGRRAHAKLAVLGIGAVAPEEGLETLGALLVSGETQIAAARVDWENLFLQDPAAAELPFFSRMKRASTSETPAPEPALAERLRGMAPGERRPYLLAHLTQLVRRALRLNESEPIGPRQGLFDLGLDSILALELKNQLAASLGRPLRATLLFSHPNLEVLTGYLLDEELRLEAPQSLVAAAGNGGGLETLTEAALAELIAKEIGSQV